ncbi:hypothetical protein C1H76_2089 [Elsinoe australis]|uniref:DUF7624 domain-containing protein n=1 Tax=Elsinoe australis TaxID=40998 RepID=A0A4U7B719_9PEZI|nr:hypothetical protein C1H76_2089 [Elsinoe australis]
MAALRSPLVPSPTPSQKAAPQSEGSPASPAPHSDSLSPRSADSLAPPSPYPQFVDPSPTESNGTDTTDIDEEAQEGINDAFVDTGMSAAHLQSGLQGGSAITSPTSPNSLARLDTTVTGPREPGSDDAPTSVIHVSQGFRNFANERQSPGSAQSRAVRSENWIASPSTPDAAKGPDDKRLSGQSPGPSNGSTETVSSTSKKPTRQDSFTDKSTSSRSQTSQQGPTTTTAPVQSPEYDLQVINVNGDLSYPETATSLNNATTEVLGLRRALTNCWNLCNTLAELSATHRHRVFSSTPRPHLQETAWTSCWRLCQELYAHHYRDDHPPSLSNIHRALDLCREFTQARFEARNRGDHTSDSILRVSFEMNTHLYNIRDRTLPPTFVKRTMDFYIAFCHRMMKQRSALPRDTDLLLGAAWNLAESLYNLRHPPSAGATASGIEDEATEEELLTSALHAAFGLSDLLKEGWANTRLNDRGTPRPGQGAFQPRAGAARGTASEGRTSSLSNRTYHDANSSFQQNGYAQGQSLKSGYGHGQQNYAPNTVGPPHIPGGHGAFQTFPAPPLPPETPVTIFDDVTDSSSPESAAAPNIMVLGSGDGRAGRQGQRRAQGQGREQGRRQAQGQGRGGQQGRWGSSASSLSESSAGSDRRSMAGSEVGGGSEASRSETSSVTMTVENRYIRLLRALLLKAGMGAGFGAEDGAGQREASDAESGAGTAGKTGQDEAGANGAEGTAAIAAARNAAASAAAKEETTSLQVFVERLPPDAFGAEPERKWLLEKYKGLVRNDPSLRGVGMMRGERFGWEETGRAVAWLLGTDEGLWGWVGELFRLVSGRGLGERLEGEMVL